LKKHVIVRTVVMHEYIWKRYLRILFDFRVFLLVECWTLHVRNSVLSRLVEAEYLEDARPICVIVFTETQNRRVKRVPVQHV
jgi:hypothetical protein